jgi:very-short-patch-repair endonuclease
LAKEWHPSKNGSLTPNDTSLNSGKIVWWKCNKGTDHEWKASIGNRAKNRGCPCCANKKLVKSNSLGYLNPELAKEWHPSKNGNLTPYDVINGSNKKVWWKCNKGIDHEWIASINGRIIGDGCSVCQGFTVVKSNCLATTYPKLAKEWHPTKNGSLTPFDVMPKTNKKVWWKCNKGDDHEWLTSVNHRSSRGDSCLVCSGRKIVLSNCLATLNPELAKEWHPTKNGKLSPFDVTKNTYKRIWWKCDKGVDHEWLTFIYVRVNGSGCPYCTLTPQSKQELTITFELINFFKINPRGFKTRVLGKIWTIDIYIPEFKLGIEFDGSYWHKDKRALDKLKTKKLEDDGFTIMRVREEPLIAITDIDVISKIPFNAKQVTNGILEHILEVYKIDERKTRKIINYLLKESIQNERGLNDYIEMILTEKAKRKSK